MKSIKTIIGALLLTLGAISVASCSQEEDNAMMQEKGNLLKIRTSVADTRGVITGTTFQKGDEIGICVTTIDGHDYTGNSQNIRATYTGTDWQLEREVELTDDEAIVYAYYPYNANATDSIDIHLNPTTTPEQTDYLQGSCQGVSINNTTANIQFKHVLTRLTLAVTKGANDVGEGVISRVRIENGLQYYNGQYVGERPTKRDTKIATRGKMSIKTGANRKITSQEDYFVEIPVNCTINASEAQNIDILLLPVSYSSIQVNTWSTTRINVILTIDGDEYRFTLDAVPESSGLFPTYSWKAGQQYTCPITINRLTDPTPEQTVGEAVYMGFDGDDGQPLYWSTMNLGATSPEDYGGLYGWGDPTGEHLEQSFSDSETYGYYMSDKEECLALYGGETPLADISGTEYDVVRAMWGADWRMPTSSEFSRLDTNCTFVWTTQNGVKGALFTSNINGNSIFLPCGTTRYGTYISDNTDDTSSSYWTSTLNDEEVERASIFVFYDSGNAWIGRGAERYTGLPIRPVTSNPE